MKDFTTELRKTLLDCSMVEGPHYWVVVWMKDYTTELKDEWWTTLLDCSMHEKLHYRLVVLMKDYTTGLKYG